MDAKPAATTVLHIVLNGVSGKQNLPESPHHNLSPFFHISQFQRIIDMTERETNWEEVELMDATHIEITDMELFDTPEESITRHLRQKRLDRLAEQASMETITVREVFEHHYGKLSDAMKCGIEIEKDILTPVIFDFRPDYNTPFSMHTFRFIHINPSDENSGYFDTDVLIKEVDDKPAVAFLNFFSFNEDNAWFSNSLKYLQNKQS